MARSSGDNQERNSAQRAPSEIDSGSICHIKTPSKGMDRDDCSNRLVSLDNRFAHEILIRGDLRLDVLSKCRGSRTGCDLDAECNEPFLNVLRGQDLTELGV